MREKKIYIRNKLGERLVGLENKPNKSATKYPTIILAHGFGGNKNENGMFDDLVESLCGEGFLTYRFDFSGCGESEGKLEEMTLSKEISELKEILNFTLKQPLVDKQRIGLIGMSFGTAVTVGLASPIPKAVILLSSVSLPLPSLKKLFGKGYNPTGISAYKSKTSGRIKKVKPEFWRDLRRYNLPSLIKQIKAPILIIHGDEDASVPVSEGKRYFKNANEPKNFRIIKGTGHGFYESRQRKEMVSLVVNWFKKYL